MDRDAAARSDHPHHLVEDLLRVVGDADRALVDGDVEAAVFEPERLRVAELEPDPLGQPIRRGQVGRRPDHVGGDVDAGHVGAELAGVEHRLGAAAAGDVEHGPAGAERGDLGGPPGQGEAARVQRLDAAQLDRVLDRRPIPAGPLHRWLLVVRRPVVYPDHARIDGRRGEHGR